MGRIFHERAQPKDGGLLVDRGQEQWALHTVRNPAIDEARGNRIYAALVRRRSGLGDPSGPSASDP